MRLAVAVLAFLVLPLTAAADASSPGGGGERASAPAGVALRRSEELLGRALAETRNARATGDPACYERALAALAEARELDPSRERVAVVEAWVRLGRHEFARAEALAGAHLRAHPDDPDAWALLGDARMELGRYRAAADAYERSMELRPGFAAYVRAAHYREASGDLAGAARLYRQALDASDRKDAEGRAWTLVQAAALEVERGDVDGAEGLLTQALLLVPEYHAALAGLAALQLRARRYEPALGFADRALAAAPHAERHLLRADALRGLGREAEARAAEEAFERLALANVSRADNENVWLVDFYLDRRPDPARALEIARAEAERRPDIGTLERLARALERSGLGDEARAARERAYGWRSTP